MSYQNYVLAAYLVFAAVLLWDFVAPRLAVRQQLRAARLRAARLQAGRRGDASANVDPETPR
ncbi:heme exporter protein CcmD [Cognatiluteimonas weifangensis]|uniref:Heme exporter protein D n=1 Tax=Cognatiluteimonas weifangensis TaxID=2303539 RepID=A0A372DKQ2_9GAMM|nr:heme exporter protein CcmD [Luteimonas weifangensis]RFP60110.1 heme exporter protein CcmD [Luteimonas weifangensis]